MDRELPVSVWPEWKITEKIGEGSFGKVYKAERSEQGKTFYSAIKVITIPSSRSELNSVRSESASDQSARQYFRSLVDECIQEVSTMEYFRGNSHIVSVEDYKVVEYLDDIGWDIYIRMEYLTSFMDYCAGRQLTEAMVIRLGIDLCRALEYCQRQNVIHRDIKPENIFVSRFGEFKLGDFGIARELEKSMSGFSKKGTYSYMAPEMYRGESYDSRVDIYSLGIVLYRLRNRNRLPFLSLEKQLITYRDKENALNRRMAGEPLPPPGEAGADLTEIILKACAYDREKRYRTPEEFRSALEELQYRRKYSGVQVTSLKQPQPSRPPQPSAAEKKAAPKAAVKNVPAPPGQTRPAEKKESPAAQRPARRMTKEEQRAAARRELKNAQKPVQRTSSSVSRSANRKSGGTGKGSSAKLAPLIAAVVVMAVAVCVVFAIFLRLLLQKPAGQSDNLVNMETQESSETAKDFEQIQEHATEIVNNLNNYNWIGSEEEGKISYLDENGKVMKVLIYPSRSAEGCYEEYYYWDEELFFAYIWADHSVLAGLDEDEVKVNLYYYKDGSLIRWIDEKNVCHDNEQQNEEYVNRGRKYWDQAAEYRNQLNAGEMEE